MESSQNPTADINPEVLKAFELMWGVFPYNALLLKRDRTVLACNQAARDRGMQPGMKCFQLNSPGVHKHCLADAALREGKAQRTVAYSAPMKKLNNSFWMPVPGEKELFVHVVIDITEYAKPELFPAQ